MKGLLSLDLLAAILFVSLLAAGAISIIHWKAAHLSQLSEVGSAERAAWSESARLLASCPEEGGLALCSGGFVCEHLLDPSAAPQAGNGTSARVFPVGTTVSGNWSGGGAVCVRRLGLLELKEVVVEVCARQN